MSLSIAFLLLWKSRQQFAEGMQSCQAITDVACAQGFTLPERNTDGYHCVNPLNTLKLVGYILKGFIKNSRFGGIHSAENFF